MAKPKAHTPGAVTLALLALAGLAQPGRAADLGVGIVPEAPPTVVGTGAPMFAPTTNWASGYVQTYVIQRPAPDGDPYTTDLPYVAAPVTILVVPPVQSQGPYR